MANGQGTELDYAALFNLFSSWGYEWADNGDTLKGILEVAKDTVGIFTGGDSGIQREIWRTGL